MKMIWLILLLALPSLIFGTMFRVALDGSQQYTHIQDAINAATWTDSILVYPGRYYENLTCNSRVIINSNYILAADTSFISTTIIDGNLSTSVFAYSSANLEMKGFTIVNDEAHTRPVYDEDDDSNWLGGGIRMIGSARVILKHCIIRNCWAGYGGGVLLKDSATLTLSDTKIYDNRADNLGGGIYAQTGNVIFDSVHRCSVFDNTSARGGMDMYFYNCSSPILANLHTASKIQSEPDGYFITGDNCDVDVNVIAASCPDINHDLYISPNGSDTNSGVLHSSPLKSITQAMRRIGARVEQPRKIYLLEGTYCSDLLNDVFPICLRSYVSIRGNGLESTNIDCELDWNPFSGSHITQIGIHDLTVTESRMSCPVVLYNTNDASFSGLDFINCSGNTSNPMQNVKGCGIFLSHGSNVLIDHVASRYAIHRYNMSGVDIRDCDNVVVNQFNYTMNHNSGWDEYSLGLSFEDSDVVVRNCSITGNSAEQADLFFYANDQGDSSYRLHMSNTLIAGNHVDWPNDFYEPILIYNYAGPSYIYNCTIANNTGMQRTVMRILSETDLVNNIIYNPQYQHNVKIENGNGFFMRVKNNLFSDSTLCYQNTVGLTAEDNIFACNPLFAGGDDDTLIPYYRLTSTSPCVNTGIANTLGMNLPLMDLEGNCRISDNNIDMGAIEYDSLPYVGIMPQDIPEPQENGLNVHVFPNPVSLSGCQGAYTFIEFSLPDKKSKPEVDIFNIKGQKVRSMHISNLPGITEAGKSTVWDCRDDNGKKVSSGIYFLRVKNGVYQTTKKMMVIK